MKQLATYQPPPNIAKAVFPWFVKLLGHTVEVELEDGKRYVILHNEYNEKLCEEHGISKSVLGASLTKDRFQFTSYYTNQSAAGLLKKEEVI